MMKANIVRTNPFLIKSVNCTRIRRRRDQLAFYAIGVAMSTGVTSDKGRYRRVDSSND
jgi:hypothetical protein